MLAAETELPGYTRLNSVSVDHSNTLTYFYKATPELNLTSQYTYPPDS